MRVAARAVLAVFVICRVAAAQVLPDIETLGKKSGQPHLFRSQQNLDWSISPQSNQT